MSVQKKRGGSTHTEQSEAYWRRNDALPENQDRESVKEVSERMRRQGGKHEDGGGAKGVMGREGRMREAEKGGDPAH